MASTLGEEEFVGDWRKEKVLGAGGFGMVVLWKNTSTNQQVALKQIRWVNDPMMTPKHKQRWTQEVDIMKRLSHPNVVSAIDVPTVLDVRGDELPLLAMEYCSGGDLRKILNRPENCCGLSEYELRKILQHVSSALGYLHARRIIHRDLKPENIVLQETDGKISYKLIDLGYAKELDQGSLCTSFVGTLQYLAPELFMTQKYTSTVDYWSLGLVTHECITGLRPFLPNWSPAQWIPHVMKKNSAHICAFLEPDGVVKFSSSLFPENHISNKLKTLIENWLAVMLEWDPQNRGCIFEDGKKKVIAFEMLDSILSKKILTVFCIQACKYLWYEIGESNTMGQVIQWIAADLYEPKSNFFFVFQQGNPFDLKKEALSYCPELDDEEWVLYVFHKKNAEIPKFTTNLPPMVERMFREPKESTVYMDQRKMWAYSVYFISRERRLYGCILQAQKVVMMNLLTRNSIIYNSNTRMVKELSRLKAKLELFEESLHCDLEKYEVQSHNGITSEIMFKNWLGSREISKKIAVLAKKVYELEGKATVVNTKTIELQRSPFARNKEPQILQEVYEKALAAFEVLRNKPKEHRHAPSNNSEMLTLVLTCIKHRERLHRDVYIHIQKLTDCTSDVQQLLDPMEAILTEINDHEKQLGIIQKERQIDIWKVIDSLRKKLKTAKTTVRPIPVACPNTVCVEQTSSLASSGTSESSSQLAQSMLNRCLQDTPSMSQENALLRSRLRGLQENFNRIQDDASSDACNWYL